MEDDDSDGQPQDSIISRNKQPSSKSKAGSSEKKVPLQDQTLKENWPTVAKRRNGSMETDENILPLQRRKRKNVGCPEMSSNFDNTKKKRKNQNKKKVLKDAQIAAANKAAFEIF